MTKSGPPTSLEPSEYEAIEKAMMETTRGRWFLAQFAERNRRQDTQVVLEAIAKLESSVSNARSQPEADRIKTDLVEMSKAIERTRNEIANLKLPDQEGGNLIGATEELDAIVSATERATNKILQAAEDIQETAWIIREDGGSIDASCARIDNDVTDIYTACSFQDITGQRTQKVVQVLTYLESRINAMVSIWGLATDDNSTNNGDTADKQLPEEEKRPDAHLLNGPQMEDEALKQHHIDDVMAEAENQGQPQTDIEALQPEDDNLAETTSEESETTLESSVVSTDTIEQNDQELPETSLEENETLTAEESQLSETPQELSNEPEQPDELALSDNPEQADETEELSEIDVSEIDIIEEELSGLEENIPSEIIAEEEEETLAENLLSELEEIATSAVEENLSIEEPQNLETEQNKEATELHQADVSDLDDTPQEQVILDHIENADLLPEDEEIKETILADDTQLTDTIQDTEENSDERAAFEQHFKKISEELQKAKQLKQQSEEEQPPSQEDAIETEASLPEEETPVIAEQEAPLDDEEQAEEAITEEKADAEFMENQESSSEAEDQEEDKTAEELRKLAQDKKSALFQ